MTSPVIHPFPVKRPGFVETASWVGDDAHLALHITYTDVGNVARSMQFECRNVSDATPGSICLPTSLLGNDLNNLGPRARDTLVAHTRMACMIAGLAVPGSKEFSDAFTATLDAINLQTALGTVKVTNVNIVDDQTVLLTFKCGTGPDYNVEVDHGELNNYVFAPETQLFVIPGSVKKQFGTYTHNYPGTILTTAQKDAIVAYVTALELWI